MAALRVTDIRTAYSKLWSRFNDAATGVGLKAKANGLGFDVTADAKGPRVDALLFLENWPYKAVSAKERVDIVIQVREQFSPTEPIITSTTTQIGYFQKRKRGSKPLLQFHYDFESPTLVAHPIFHAQLGETNWPEIEIYKLGFQLPILVSPIYYKNPRIPTAFMGYGPVLLAMAADHLNDTAYATFLTSIRENPSVRWNAACPALESSVRKYGGYLHSYHWYQ